MFNLAKHNDFVYKIKSKKNICMYLEKKLN